MQGRGCPNPKLDRDILPAFLEAIPCRNLTVGSWSWREGVGEEAEEVPTAAMHLSLHCPTRSVHQGPFSGDRHFLLSLRT